MWQKPPANILKATVTTECTVAFLLQEAWIQLTIEEFEEWSEMSTKMDNLWNWLRSDDRDPAVENMIQNDPIMGEAALRMAQLAVAGDLCSSEHANKRLRLVGVSGSA